MFEFIKDMWFPSDKTAKMPLLEKERGEKIPYSSTIRFVKAQENIDIAYIDEGKKNGEVLVFIHGMGGAIPTWRKNISFLRTQYRCIAIDLPGHGHSSKDEYPFTMAFYTDILLSFLDKLGLRDVTLIGHSMGSQIATLTAIKQQDRIAKLILVSPSGLEPYTAAEKQMLINLQLSVTAGAQAFIMHKFNYLIGFCNDHKMAADILKRLPVFQEDAYIFGKMMLRSVESMLLESVDGVLSKVKVPCLVILGKEDKVSPYSHLRSEEYYEIVSRQSRQLKKGRAVVFKTGCHFIHYQRPKTFNSVVVNFLQENDNNDTDKIKP